jgi:proline iminopeptidase
MRTPAPRPCTWLALLVTAASCGPPRLAPGEGTVEVPGGRVWYRVVGGGTRTPLLVVHGCCGVGSYYLQPLAALADERPVVFYDQLGAGRSTAPADTAAWRLDRFVEELALVRRALGLREVHIYGHSWGGGLAVEYMHTGPSGVRSLVLAGAGFSPELDRRASDSLFGTLPDSVLATLGGHMQAGTCDTPEYRTAMREVYRRWFARREPWSAEFERTLASVARRQAMYRQLGESTCADPEMAMLAADRTTHLAAIAVPTLIAVGALDLATPASARFYQGLVPGAELAVFDSSAHLPMHDEPARYVATIRDFLRRVESR